MSSKQAAQNEQFQQQGLQMQQHAAQLQQQAAQLEQEKLLLTQQAAEMHQKMAELEQIKVQLNVEREEMLKQQTSVASQPVQAADQPTADTITEAFATESQVSGINIFCNFKQGCVYCPMRRRDSMIFSKSLNLGDQSPLTMRNSNDHRKDAHGAHPFTCLEITIRFLIPIRSTI